MPRRTRRRSAATGSGRKGAGHIPFRGSGTAGSLSHRSRLPGSPAQRQETGAKPAEHGDRQQDATGTPEDGLAGTSPSRGKDQQEAARADGVED